MKRKALADFPDRPLVDFGIGENDAMAPVLVRQRMTDEVNKPKNRGYADNGIAAYKEAVARFMQRQFGVQNSIPPPKSTTASVRRPCCR